MKKLEGKVALVTGAARGIGYACAEAIAAEGAKVVLTGHNLEHVENAAETLRQKGYDAVAKRLDASDMDNCLSATKEVVDEYGRLDILVNNVGGTDLRKDGPVGDLDLDYFDTAMRFNVLSMLATIKAALPSMIEHGEGSIVNIASIGGITGDFRGTLYGASKAAVINVCRYVATQYGKKGIRCNGVAPGLILTDAANDNLDESIRNIFLRQNALPYFGKPEDIGSIAAFLASDDARYITGQTIVADGGLTCHNPTIADILKY